MRSVRNPGHDAESMTLLCMEATSTHTKGRSEEHKADQVKHPNDGATRHGRLCLSCEAPVPSKTAEFREDCGCRL